MIAEATETKKPDLTKDPVALMGRVCELARTKGGDAMQRINTYIRQETKCNTITNFVADPKTDNDRKILLLGRCFAALMRDELDKLCPAPAGQAAAPEKQPEPEPIQVNRVPETQPKSDDDVAGMLRQIIEKVGVKAKAENPEINLTEIVEQVTKAMEPDLTKLREELMTKLQEVKESSQPAVLTFQHKDREDVQIEGLYHWQLPQLVTWLKAGVPLWVWGQAGGGKTFLAYQIAKALGVEAVVVSIDPTMTVGKLLGFRNLANGEFIEGFAYSAYKEGKLLCVDEVDTGDPGILAALNAMIANDNYLFPNGELVKRHENFRIMAGANTKGTGAVAGYTARNRLDAATLDRFAVVELEYDEWLEMALASGYMPDASDRKSWKQNMEYNRITTKETSKWVGWVQSVRKLVGGSVLISPRASINGCRAICAGVPIEEVAEALVFRFCTPDTKQNIINHVGKAEL